MTNYSDVRVFLCTTPTNMHYSFDRWVERGRSLSKIPWTVTCSCS